MKKKLNFFCIVLLILMIVGMVMAGFAGVNDFKQGYEDGMNDSGTSAYSIIEGLIIFACFIVKSCSSFNFRPIEKASAIIRIKIPSVMTLIASLHVSSRLILSNDMAVHITVVVTTMHQPTVRSKSTFAQVNTSP